MDRILEVLRGYGELTKGLSFNAVTRHPLADETEWLEKLDVKPEDCDSCDVILAFKDQLVFISLFSTKNGIGRSHVFYKFDDEALFGGDHFSVATVQFPLKTQHVEKMLQYLSVWLTDENNKTVRKKTSKLIQINTIDICW